jgi:hypothetical protein
MPEELVPFLVCNGWQLLQHGSDSSSLFTVPLVWYLQSASGNAAKAGLKAGDTIIYASSFFGDELWPADKVSFTQSAINAAPSPM